jgi:CheY-like chemotaxis protein
MSRLVTEFGSPSGDWFSDNLDAIREIRLDGFKVLITDDSPDNQLLFSRILRSAGALVDSAENGEIAAKAFESVREDAIQGRLNKYDLVIMDIRMPICDGYEASRLIRQSGYTGPIIALTANHFPDERERCLNAGCDDFYSKPIDRLSLLRAVQRALRG